MSILKAWLIEHKHDAYPSYYEKQILSYLTDMSVQQVSNWFVNARRRMLPKFLTGKECKMRRARATEPKHYNKLNVLADVACVLKDINAVHKQRQIRYRPICPKPTVLVQPSVLVQPTPIIFYVLTPV